MSLARYNSNNIKMLLFEFYSGTRSPLRFYLVLANNVTKIDNQTPTFLIKKKIPFIKFSLILTYVSHHSL